MANIKKSFNFRNGVQVDEDNLLVTPTGLVAIGKTIPTEALDVIGNVVISGVTSSVFAQAGVLTATTFNPTQIIGAGVSIVSGIITNPSMDATGIVTYYGDGRFLQGLPTSQWVDTNAGFGVSSIYNTGGTVGIATTNPQSTLQVGNDPFSSGIGVGIASAGNIRASGTITATTLVGAVTGDVTGNILGNITGNVTGNLTGLVNSSGISTFGGINATGRIVGAATSNVIPFFYSNLSDLPSAVTYHGAFAHVHATGRGYYAHGGNWIELVNKDTSGNLSLSGDLDVDGHTNLDNVSISGVSTFSEDVITGVGATVGLGTDVFFGDNVKATFGSGNEVKMFHKPDTDDFRAELVDTNLIIMSRTLDFKNQAGDKATITAIEPGGISEVRLFNDGNEKLRTTGIGVTIFNQLDTTNIVASGVITATTVLNSPLLGVGTNNPANDIQVRKTGNTEIQVTSDTGSAGLTVGRESGTSNTNNAEFRYGLVSGGSPNSSAQSLDILNYGTENFNYHLSAANANTVNGNFHWHKGPNTTLMTLTGIGGSLGIATKDPITPLHVQGAGTITGSLTVGNNLSVGGNLILESAISGNLTGNVTGNVTGDINSSATSTFNNTNATGVSTFTSIYSLTNIGIAVPPSLPLSVNTNASNRFFVNGNGNVGIKTTDSAGNTLLVAGSIVGQIIGAGTTQPLSTVDFSLAGQGLGGAFTNKMFMIPPKVTNAQRGNLAGLVSGAMIYNTDLNKLQVYNGTAWETVTSS
tara:strand:- start:1781 stop:4039 length:2259 start_codon:yes stop_codon:yes gene_type:complete